MIRVADLDFHYGGGDFSLRIPELAVQSGERVALIGPSGSGKTTLLHLIAGIVSPRAGRIVTAGSELESLDEAARRTFRIRQVGLVFQDFALLEYLDVLDNILLPFRMHHALRLDAAVHERARSLASQVGIADKLGRLPDQLSQGERQRAAICRALVAEPTLILADEPTGNLDPRNGSRVVEILLDYSADRGATLLTVTHDRDMATRFDRVIDLGTLAEASA